MATMPDRRPRFRSSIFWCLIFLGCFRCVYDLVFFPSRFQSLSWLSPRPQVFVDSHYLQKQRLRLNYRNGSFVELNLNTVAEWPLEGIPLISYYTLVHCLDRPQMMSSDLCLPNLKFHFCDPDSTRSRVKSALRENPISSLTVLNGKLEPLREYFHLECQR